MSKFLDGLGKSDARALRKEMLKQAFSLYNGFFPSRKQQWAAARKMVDQALAKERLAK